MLCKIILFFNELQQSANVLKRKLKIGLSINSYSQSILSGKYNILPGSYLIGLHNKTFNILFYSISIL